MTTTDDKGFWAAEKSVKDLKSYQGTEKKNTTAKELDLEQTGDLGGEQAE